MLSRNTLKSFNLKALGKCSYFSDSFVNAAHRNCFNHVDISRRFNTTKTTKPLEGIRVLELGQV
jgi:hypothetical protein